MCDNADRVKEMAKCLDNFKCQHSEIGSVFWCSKTTEVLLELTVLLPKNVGLLHYYCIRNKDIVLKCMYTVYAVHIYSRDLHVH